jgi:radical SAM enzyme (TIGR01210 family)
MQKKENTITKQILFGSKKAGKTYAYDETHDETRLAQMWFQESMEGKILFAVFYTQACRWSRCLGCNLPSLVSSSHVPYSALMAQIDNLFCDPKVVPHLKTISKMIVSNNGSVLDEDTFSSTALMYLIAKINLNLPNLRILAMETRPEYVETAELEFIARALAEGDTPTKLELAIGFEAFDEKIRNDIFDKGLSLEAFEGLVKKVAPYGYHIKCYFMQKPVPGIADSEAVADIQRAIDYLTRISKKYGVAINMHLNPTYVASGTGLETAFLKGDFTPPLLEDVARAVVHGKGKKTTIFIGLSDEGLAVAGGSFLREGSALLVEGLENFNRSQDFTILEKIIARAEA